MVLIVIFNRKLCVEWMGVLDEIFMMFEEILGEGIEVSLELNVCFINKFWWSDLYVRCSFCCKVITHRQFSKKQWILLMNVCDFFFKTPLANKVSAHSLAQNFKNSSIKIFSPHIIFWIHKNWNIPIKSKCQNRFFVNCWIQVLNKFFLP